MDTKLKKSKAVISLVSFFLSMGVLIATAVFGVSFLLNYDYAMDDIDDLRSMGYIGELSNPDYQYTNAFRDEISQTLVRMLNTLTSGMEIEDALETSTYYGSDGTVVYSYGDPDDPFGLDRDTARNLLYQAGPASNTAMYTNNPETTDLFQAPLPEGYNFRLIFNGKTVSIEKDGEPLNIYYDGFFRSNSDMWDVPGYENMSPHPEYEDLRVCLVARKTPVEPVNGYSELYDITQEGKDTQLFLRIWGGAMIAAVLLLITAFLWRKERRALSIQIAARIKNIYFEWKVLFAIVVFCFSIAFTSSVIPLNIVLFLLSLPGYYLIVVDLRYNHGNWKHNVVNVMLQRRAAYRKAMEQKLPLERRLLERWDDFVKCESITLGVGLVLSILTAGVLAPFTIALMVYFVHRYGKQHRQLARDLGRLTTQIATVQQGGNTTPLLFPKDADLWQAAQALNDIEYGINSAVEARVKSERMKVELITNVSHDIKTPLTSIISYVDLLKQEESLPPDVKDYVKILDEKSQRLKNMIQDIFEVSKAASGNIDLQMEPLDLGKLMRQTLADMDEAISDAQLLFRVDIPEEPVMITADGRRLYRVFQNLISNALRYSLDGTRVFVSLAVEDDDACAVLKNVSRYELDPTVDITERFVRGDAARTTAGSGLGLSIAKSFTEACGGAFSVYSDADLFVAEVRFSVCK